MPACLFSKVQRRYRRKATEMLRAILATAITASLLLAASPAWADSNVEQKEAAAVTAVQEIDPQLNPTAARVETATVAAGPVSVVIEGATGDSESTDGGVVLDGRSADYVVRDLEAGTQILAVQQKPFVGTTLHEYRFSGDFLEILDSGHVVVRDSIFGEPTALIDPAWALDADGLPVTTSYQVEGDTLVQSVTTTVEDSFPVVSDPLVNTYWWGLSVDFSKSETNRIALGGTICALAVGKIGVPGAIVGGFCLAYSAVAQSAKDQNKCISARYVHLTNLFVPWITKCW